MTKACDKQINFKFTFLLFTNINQKLVNSHRLLNSEIGGLDCHVITTEDRTHVHFIHIHVTPILHWLVHVIYFRVSGQCLYTISQ